MKYEISNAIMIENSETGVVSRAEVYALEKALIESGYAMKTNVRIVETEEQLLKRGSRLGSAPSGSGHCNYLLGIIVRMDVKFTNKVWVEAERYHWFDISTSQSTMHRITKFDLDEAFHKKTDPYIINRMKELVGEYNDIVTTIKLEQESPNPDLEILKKLTHEKNEQYLTVLYSNPAGFTLTAGISTNYLQLKTMVVQRFNHKLPEWREFTKWCFDLPYFEELTGLSKEKYVLKGE